MKNFIRDGSRFIGSLKSTVGLIYNIINGRMFGDSDFLILLYHSFDKLNPMRQEPFSYHIIRFKKQLKHDVHYLVGLFLIKKEIK